MIPTIKTSEFVKRQTKTSEFSYYDGKWEDVEKMVTLYFNESTPEFCRRLGYREGVYLVSVPPKGFYSSLIELNDSIVFETIYESRRPGEKPYKKNIAYGIKQPANYVDVVLYAKHVLEEDETDRASLTGADYEIVSVNARTMKEEAPMTPQTMARNQLANEPVLGKGGTKANYTGDEFAKSIIFWNTHSLIRERGLQ
jgi:hypothetical protein